MGDPLDFILDLLVLSPIVFTLLDLKLVGTEGIGAWNWACQLKFILIANLSLP